MGGPGPKRRLLADESITSTYYTLSTSSVAYTSDTSTAGNTSSISVGTLFNTASLPMLSLGVKCTLPASTSSFDSSAVNKNKYLKNMTAVVATFSGVDNVAVSSGPSTASGGGVVRLFLGVYICS